MRWSPKYIEASLYYEPWKTKFIEVICRELPRLRHEYKNLETDIGKDYINFVMHFCAIFKTVLIILNKRLYCTNGIYLRFNSDVIFESYKNGLIRDKNLYNEVLLFLHECHIDEKYCVEFKSEYMNLLEDFFVDIKPLIKNEGFREKDYYIYDNTYCLWGLEKKHYLKIVQFFSEYENLKIVRICGSRVTDSYRKFSDIDLICEGTYSAYELDKILYKMQKLEIPYFIDMNDIYKKSKPFIYRNVLRSNIFYRRSDYFKDDYKSVIN